MVFYLKILYNKFGQYIFTPIVIFTFPKIYIINELAFLLL